ncbi:MAG: hypothetical protein V4683_08420 [Bacteroidota bacterium]
MNEIENYYNQLLTNVSLVTGLVNLLSVIIISFFYKYFNNPIRLFYYYLLARLFLEILTKIFIWSTAEHYAIFWKPILDYFQIYDTNFFNGIFYFTNFLFIGFFYRKIIANRFITSKLAVITIGLCIFQIANYFFIDGFQSYGTIGVTLSDIFLIILPCIYLYQMSNNPPNINLQKNSYFWISLALFIPHLLQMVITFTASDLHKTNFILFCKTHIFRNIILIFSQLLFLHAFSKAKYLKYI